LAASSDVIPALSNCGETSTDSRPTRFKPVRFTPTVVATANAAMRYDNRVELLRGKFAETKGVAKPPDPKTRFGRFKTLVR